MTLTEQLVELQIAHNLYHATGMLKVLECVNLADDEQRIVRCELYSAWKKYLENSQEFTSKAKAKVQARKYAIAGAPVPDEPMEYEPTHTMILEALADGG